MPDASKTSVFSTERFLAMTVFQNHLDEIHGIFNQFCGDNKSYRWYLRAGARRVSGVSEVERYLAKHKPKKLFYVVTDVTSSRELSLEIDNGLTLNIKNGSHSLYGLFKQIIDISPSINAPRAFVFIRRYWLFNLLAAILIIPSVIIVLLGGGWYFLFWFVIVLFLEIAGGSQVFSEATQDDWDQMILSTTIGYGTHNTKSGSIVYAVFGSTKAIVSILASVATVASFVIYLLSRQ